MSEREQKRAPSPSPGLPNTVPACVACTDQDSPSASGSRATCPFLLGKISSGRLDALSESKYNGVSAEALHLKISVFTKPHGSTAEARLGDQWETTLLWSRPGTRVPPTSYCQCGPEPAATASASPGACWAGSPQRHRASVGWEHYEPLRPHLQRLRSNCPGQGRGGQVLVFLTAPQAPLKMLGNSAVESQQSCKGPDPSLSSTSAFYGGRDITPKTGRQPA